MALRIDFTEILENGNRWTYFARDFLVELGFRIEQRSLTETDGEPDTVFTAVEQVKGKFNTYPFRWLVSARHKTSPRSTIKESEDYRAVESLREHSVDGFLGFYSVPPSSALLELARSVQAEGLVKAFRFFEPEMIENALQEESFLPIVKRYFPKSYANSSPTQVLYKAYIPLKCDCCGKDLLESMYRDSQPGVITWVREKGSDDIDPTIVHDIYFSCKGTCDETLQGQFTHGTGWNATAWVSLDRIMIPPVFLDRYIALIDRLYGAEFTYTPIAFEKEKLLLRAIAQKIFRDTSETEKHAISNVLFTPE